MEAEEGRKKEEGVRKDWLGFVGVRTEKSEDDDDDGYGKLHRKWAEKLYNIYFIK